MHVQAAQRITCRGMWEAACAYTHMHDHVHVCVCVCMHETMIYWAQGAQYIPSIYPIHRVQGPGSPVQFIPSLYPIHPRASIGEEFPDFCFNEAPRPKSERKNPLVWATAGLVLTARRTPAGSGGPALRAQTLALFCYVHAHTHA